MSKKDYKINEPQPTNAELDKFKDFDKVIQNVPAASASQSFWTKLLQPQGLATIATIAVAGSITAYVLLREPQDISSDTDTEIVADNEASPEETTIAPNLAEGVATTAVSEKARVQPPMPKYDVPFETFKVDASTGGQLLSQNGSLITVAPNCFTTQNGKAVDGEVEILYREFHDPISIFLAGVPMNYDTLGETRIFESAGMLEIYAEKDGKRLSLAPNESISVEMVSLNDNPTDFNVYQFDTTQGKWDYIDECETKAFVDYQQTESSMISNEILAPKPPIFRQWDKDKYAFKAQIDFSEFPELSNDAMFVVNDSLSYFDPMWYQVQWDEVSLQKSTHPKHYTLHLKKEEKDISLEAYPVLSAEKYKAAMNKYQKELQQFESSKQNKTSFTLSIYNEETSETQKEIAKLLKLNSNSSGPLKKKLTLRPLVIRALGLWNCDQPLTVTQVVYNGGTVMPYFKNQNQESLHPKKIYNVAGRKNCIFTNGSGQLVNYSQKDKNLMWVVLDNESIAIAKPEEFENINGGQHQFTMSVYPAHQGLKKLKEEMR